MSSQSIRACALVAGVASLAPFVHQTRAASVTAYNGQLGQSPAPIDPAFVAATADHAKKFIDFDGDGFDDLQPHTFRPIPSDHYAALGVTLLNLDARSVDSQPWAHSPPIGAWHTGFSLPITTPYSFVFDEPIASFGLFANDLEASMGVNVSLVGGAVEHFNIGFQGNAGIEQFHGYVAPTNSIVRLDFLSTDYHIIDDVQIGRVVPEPATALAMTFALILLGRRTGERNGGLL
jgi:hypothetical protein